MKLPGCECESELRGARECMCAKKLPWQENWFGVNKERFVRLSDVTCDECDSARVKEFTVWMKGLCTYAHNALPAHWRWYGCICE